MVQNPHACLERCSGNKLLVIPSRKTSCFLVTFIIMKPIIMKIGIHFKLGVLKYRTLNFFKYLCYCIKDSRDGITFCRYGITEIVTESPGHVEVGPIL